MRYDFSACAATASLHKLAQRAPDLTAENVLVPQRMERYKAEGASWKLLYGTQRIDEAVLKALFALAEEAQVYEKFASMCRGEIINAIEGYASEERAVLHTAVRDLFEEPQPQTVEARQKAHAECEKLKAFLSEIGNSYHHLVVIGIGGSNLGPQALYQALAPYYLPERQVHFISSIDPDAFHQVFLELELSKTLVVVISKSGFTLETHTNEAFAREEFKNAGLDPLKHFLAITTEGSSMDRPEHYLKVFYIWDYIGGRFCATAMPGGLLVGFACGFPVYWEILKGAHEMDRVAAREDPSQNLPLLLALLGIWNRNFLNHPCCGVIPYSYALRRFAAHIQQLDMESNGKHIDRFGLPLEEESSPIIFGEPGTDAQHSFFQMIHQGTTVVPLEFIGCRQSQYEKDFLFQESTSQQKLRSNLFGQSIALAAGKSDPNPNKQFSGNRPSLILLTEKLTPFSLGALYSLYEHKVAFQGFIWQTNSFDQEGVTLGKQLAKELLAAFKDKDNHSIAHWFLQQ